ncbi:hypothetical protein BC628DRAFT_1424168 [Trametes gibbosa]|nr:hypothetical protein BC628DRAFT_1424168 [Trametes gibbosa]UVI59118.1 Zn(2)-Cys(6)15 [Trametes gibbosa]
MSTAHLSLDDYAFPGNKPHSSYELSYALGAPPASSLYPHAGLEAQPSGSHTQTRFHPHHSGGAHPTYLPDHPEAYLEQYYLGMGSMGYPQFEGLTPPYPMAHHPPSPRTVYAANSGWEAAEGYGAPLDSTASSPSSFLHSLQNVIDSSHTSQVQQQTSGQAQLAPAQLPPPSPPSWTLSGSLDPATGVFQRSVEHPRLRTAQACEKCRTRKAKCSGDHPTCQRCLSRGLQCEYAPERKMRGPNKQKRKSVSQKPTDTPPSSGRRSSVVSVASTASSSSDASALDAHASAAAAAVAAVNGTRPSSRASLHRGMQASPRRAAPRPRSSTIALGAIKRAAEYAPPSALHRQHGTGTPPLRQRPPPLDLSGVRQFAQHPPNMLAQYTRGGEPLGAYGPPPAPGFAGAAEARSPSLPPYLLDAYSRIAFADAAAVSAQDALFGGPSAAAFVAAESSGMARYVPPPYSPH